VLFKINRLKKGKLFKETIQFGETFKGDFLILKKKKIKLKKTIIGFVVSKKVSLKAVKRNKLKRRLREAVRKMLGNIKDGYSVVFFAKKEAENKNYQQIRKEIENLIQKSGLSKNEKHNFKTN